MKKILKLDSSYRVIEGEGVEIMDNLPKGVYELKFAEMQGFWFEKIELDAFPGQEIQCNEREKPWCSSIRTEGDRKVSLCEESGC